MAGRGSRRIDSGNARICEDMEMLSLLSGRNLREEKKFVVDEMTGAIVYFVRKRRYKDAFKVFRTMEQYSLW